VSSLLVNVVVVAQSVPSVAAEALPRALRSTGPQGLAVWQWLALPVLAVAALALGRVLGAVTRSLLARVARRTASIWDERWLARVTPSLTAIWAVLVAAAALPWLELPAPPSRFAVAVLTAAGVIAIFWMLLRSVDTLLEMVIERSWAAGDPSARSMLLVGGNLLKAAVMVMGAITTAATFGYPVTTVVAGLGIGGIAFAFGAQKTVENLFGSIALATDQPCRVGDTVRVEDVVGQVEYIGARSTRIRTADRTLVTIPNGRLADSRIESYALRDRIRFQTTLTLGYGATEAQVRAVLAGLEAALRAHPLVWQDVTVARLANLGPATIDIELLCWVATTDYETFRVVRQELLLGVMRVVEDSGASFAHLPPPPPSL
jgi:MscS family membrane protein